MTAHRAGNRGWFYQFIRAIALAQLAWTLVTFVDLVLHPIAPDIRTGSIVSRLISGLVLIPIYLLLAGLVLRRAGGNLIGWLLVLFAALNASDSLRPESFNGYAAELNMLFSNLAWPAIWILPIYFPDGRAYPRWLGWVAQVAVVILIVSNGISTFGNPLVNESLVFRGGTANQLFIPSLRFITDSSISNLVFGIVLIGLIVCMLVSIVLRYRASHGRERQQIKFMLWMACLLIGFAIIGGKPVTGILYDNPTTLTGWRLWLYPFFSLAFGLLPLFGISLPILRHRLWDIDIIIRRTLVYTILTAILATVYLGVVVATQQILRALTGQTTDLAVVVSTLAVAVLFAPLRVRIQAIIDRRLYRRKYDAEQTLAQFAAVARDETNLDNLRAQLLQTVAETMQPVRASLWLAQATQKDSGVPL